MGVFLLKLWLQTIKVLLKYREYCVLPTFTNTGAAPYVFNEELKKNFTENASFIGESLNKVIHAFRKNQIKISKQKEYIFQGYFISDN